MSLNSVAVPAVIALLLGGVVLSLLPESKGKTSLLCNFETGEAWRHETYWLGDYGLKRVTVADDACKIVCGIRK